MEVLLILLPVSLFAIGIVSLVFRIQAGRWPNMSDWSSNEESESDEESKVLKCVIKYLENNLSQEEFAQLSNLILVKDPKGGSTDYVGTICAADEEVWFKVNVDLVTQEVKFDIDIESLVVPFGAENLKLRINERIIRQFGGVEDLTKINEHNVISSIFGYANNAIHLETFTTIDENEYKPSSEINVGEKELQFHMDDEEISATAIYKLADVPWNEIKERFETNQFTPTDDGIVGVEGTIVIPFPLNIDWRIKVLKTKKLSFCGDFTRLNEVIDCDKLLEYIKKNTPYNVVVSDQNMRMYSELLSEERKQYYND